MFERFTVNQQSQPHSSTQLSHPVTGNSNSEIDLRELFKVLWNGKLLIILTSFTFAIASICFVLIAQEWWSSQAKITKPQLQDLAAYQQQVSQFQPIFNVYQDDGTVLVGRDLDGLAKPNVLFKRFIDAFNSTNNKRDFLDNNLEFKNIEPERDLSDEAYINAWFKRIKASLEDSKDSTSPYFIVFQSTTKESSYELLKSYILATESKVRQDALNNLQAVINIKKNELIQQKVVTKTQAKNKLAVETETAKYALKIAQSAGVDKPSKVSNDSEIFTIDLGSKGLEAKVQALETVKNLSVIEPRLQQINAKLDMLDNLKINRNIDFQTFRFLENVKKPISRDKPKRVLIILFSTLFGGVIGVAFVLMRFALRKEE
nr:Wzz/FepE/Etk N-terminal domain-containing protein [Vibrio sp. Isolate22]